MNTYTIFSVVVLISALVVSTTPLVQTNQLKSSVFVSEPYEIFAKQGKSLYSNLGNVLYKDCGGAGRLLQWRTEACTSSLVGGACLMPAEQQFRCEVSFIPSGPTEFLSARLLVNDNQGDEFTWQNTNISTSGPIQAGKAYSLKTAIGVGSNLRGKMLTVQLKMYRESDKTVETCSEAEFLIV